jgi:hypothetical protein
MGERENSLGLYGKWTGPHMRCSCLPVFLVATMYGTELFHLGYCYTIILHVCMNCHDVETQRLFRLKCSSCNWILKYVHTSTNRIPFCCLIYSLRLLQEFMQSFPNEALSQQDLPCDEVTVDYKNITLPNLDPQLLINLMITKLSMQKMSFFCSRSALA